MGKGNINILSFLYTNFLLIINVVYLINKKHKVEVYWPDEVGDSLEIGSFVITTEAVKKTVDYSVRIMTVRKSVNNVFTGLC